MKNIILLTKYYLSGFILAAGIGCLFILYSLFIDDTYSFIDFSLYMQVNSIMAVFLGLHLFVMKYIDQPQQIKNQYLRRFYTIFASYWIGIIFSFLILSLILFLNTLFSINYISFIQEDNLLQITLLIALPFARHYDWHYNPFLLLLCLYQYFPVPIQPPVSLQVR